MNPFTPYNPDRIRELCAMSVEQLDQELLNLCRKITQPYGTISFTSNDVEDIRWQMAFIQRIQNQKRRNPARVVKHVQQRENPKFIIPRYTFGQ